MALGNKSVLIDNALASLFGQGYSMRNIVKVPSDEAFPDSIRHFDGSGLSFLTPTQSSVQASNNACVANVQITSAVCANCGKIYYRVEDVVVLTEFSKNPSFPDSSSFRGYY